MVVGQSVVSAWSRCERNEVMSFLQHLRQLPGDTRGHSFVQYSSLALLVAIAVLALFAQAPSTP